MMLKYIIIISCIIHQQSICQVSENCFETVDFENGKGWANEMLTIIKGPIYDSEGNISYTKCRYFMCDESVVLLSDDVYEIYSKLLEKDSITVIPCLLDLGSECYFQGFHFALDSAISHKNLGENYLRNKKKKANRIARRKTGKTN